MHQIRTFMAYFKSKTMKMINIKAGLNIWEPWILFVLIAIFFILQSYLLKCTNYADTGTNLMQKLNVSIKNHKFGLRESKGVLSGERN